MSFLFTADIDQTICDRFAEYYEEKLKSNILVVPRHGKSENKGFFRMVSPDLAVISVEHSKWRNLGREKEILNKLMGMAIEVLSTDKQGTIVLETDGKKIWK